MGLESSVVTEAAQVTAVAQVQFLAQEILHAMGGAKKKKKKGSTKDTKEVKLYLWLN